MFKFGFTLTFLKVFFIGLFFVSPVLLTLTAGIVVIGLFIGSREGWTRHDALYFSFVTAATVGYGDFRPTTKITKGLTVAIAFLGLVLTGIIVAVGIKATLFAFERHVDVDKVKERFLFEPPDRSFEYAALIQNIDRASAESGAGPRRAGSG